MSHSPGFSFSRISKLLLGVALILSCSAAHAKKDWSAPPEPGQPWQAEQPGFGDPDYDPKHPYKRFSLAKEVGKELKYNATEAAKDMAFVFSSRDIDPYQATRPPKNKPYTLASFALVDGTTAKMLKFPDGSGRIDGGFANGTVIIPTGDRTWLIKYPNNVQGQLKELSNGDLQINRPDNTVTVLTKQSNGRYRIANDQLGYMGELRTDGIDVGY